MNYKINYTGGTNTDHIGDLEEEIPKTKDHITAFQVDSIISILEYSNISEIKKYCYGLKKGCEAINWKYLLETRNMIEKNTYFDNKQLRNQEKTLIDTITEDDWNKYIEADTCLRLPSQNSPADKTNQKYCIIFFKKYTEKCKRTDDDIKAAASSWLNNKEGAIERYGHVSDWDVSAVTDMSKLFMGHIRRESLFNEDISSWDVSNVTNMESMFSGAKSFNQDIGSWNVSKVENMSLMFNGASSFNQDIGEWDVSSVKNMEQMFSFTDVFNGDISKWDVSKVTDMESMFAYSNSFDRDLSSWNVSSENTNIKYMFNFSNLEDKPPSWYVKPN